MFRIATVLCLSLLSFSGISTASQQDWKTALHGSYRLKLSENQIVEFDINKNLEVIVWSWNDENG